MNNDQPINVIQIANHLKKTDMARLIATKAAMDKFFSLMQQQGCSWVSLSGFAPDGTFFRVESYSRDDCRNPGFEYWVTPPKK